MLQHHGIDVCPSFCLLHNFYQHSRLGGDSFDFSGKDLRDRKTLPVESCILVVPLHDDRAIKLNASIQATALYVTPQWLVVLHHFRLDDPAGSHWTGNYADFPTKRNTDFAEGFQCFPIIDNNHTVVNINASHETNTQGVNKDAGGGRPAAVFLSCDQYTGTSGSRNPQPSSHDSEDCKSDTVLDHLLRDLDEYFGFVFWTFSGWGSGFLLVEAIFCFFVSWFSEGEGQGSLLQNDFRIRAALSDSWSSVVGQKASEPILFVSLLTGTPSFSNPAHALSNAALLPCFVLSQADMMMALK